MAIPVKSNLDLGQNQILNVVVQNLSSDPGSPLAGQVWFNTTSHLLKIYDGTTVQILAEKTFTLDQFGAPAADVSFNSHKITNLADPTNPTDGATKEYVDAVAVGLDIHASVRAASTGNVVVASGLVNGVSIDGITVNTGDRILLHNQTAPAENGIYIVAASGAAARASDLNSSANYLAGVFVFVEQGTTNAATGWIVTTQGTITVGVTSVTWTQMSGSTSYTAGNGLTLTGNSFAVNTDASTTYIDGSNNVAVKSSATAGQVLRSNGSSTTPTWGALDLSNANAVANALPINRGGTGQITAAAALTALGGTTKFSSDIGDGSTTSIVVTHNLGTKDCHVQVRDNTTPFQQFEVEIQYTSTNTVTVIFSVAPTSNQYRCIVIG